MREAAKGAGRDVRYSAQWLGGQLAQARVEASPQAGFSAHEPGRRGPRVVFTDYDIHYILSGELSYIFESQTLSARAGDFCLLPPRLPFYEQDPPGRRGARVYFAHFQFVSPLGDPLRILELPARVRGAGRGGRAFFEGLLQSAREARAGEHWALLRAQGDLLRLLACVLEAGFRLGSVRVDPRRVGPGWLWSALQEIEGSLARPELDVDELARAAHLSPSHFAHQFRRHAGLAPMPWLLRKRMERACALLVSANGLTIKEISLRCGFTDPYPFSAQFKKWAKVSPSDYRRSRDMQPAPGM